MKAFPTILLFCPSNLSSPSFNLSVNTSSCINRSPMFRQVSRLGVRPDERWQHSHAHCCSQRTPRNGHGKCRMFETVEIAEFSCSKGLYRYLSLILVRNVVYAPPREVCPKGCTIANVVCCSVFMFAHKYGSR
jgi:hypothetical protein